MRTAYIDMIGGVSGDILLGALIDAGLRLDDLNTALAGLKCGGFNLSASRVHRGGIEATLIGVELDGDGERHRDWAEFESTIRDSTLSEVVKTASLEVFDLLARAESAAHGVGKEETHLHELGTVDTLVDVVGVIAGLEIMGVGKVHASPFPLSSGTSRSSHGVMGATAAATAEIYRMKSVPVRAGGMHSPVGEAVTPTGAALVCTIASFSPVAFNAQAVGYGAGNRNPDGYPNVAGLWLGEAIVAAEVNLPLDTDVRLLETNIDDMTGEAIAYLQERLMYAGALDAWVSPIQMKKGRPAVMLSALCRPAIEGDIVRLILRESTTLGVRRRAVERYVAEREMITVAFHGEAVSVKVKRLDGQVAGIHPEYEDCKRVALRAGSPLRDVMAEATDAARRQLEI